MALGISNGRSGSSSRPAAQLALGTPTRVLFTLTIIAGLLTALLSAAFAQDQPADLTEASATPAATPSAEMPRLELDLQEVNESDLAGTVTLFDNGDTTIVEFAAEGAGGDHPAAIVPGVCDDLADNPLAELEDVDDRGEGTSVVDSSLDNLLAEDHSIVVYMSADSADTVIACAFIEGEPTVGPAGTPVASPEATPDDSGTPVAIEDDGDMDGVGGSTSTGDGTGGTDAGTSDTADANALTINLVDWSETGITGTATLTESGNVTEVKVELNGEGIVGGHELHIHNGTCSTPGSATYTLTPIDANGTSTSNVNLTLDQLTNGNYFINVHPDEANWDAWMVCGNITGTPTTAGTGGTTTGTNQTGDGSSGGNTTVLTTNAQAGEFPTTVGVGDALRWPSDSRTAAIWAVTTVAVTSMLAGVIFRFGERSGKQARFTRLGL